MIDPRDVACASGPTATNLCGFGSAGGAMVVAEMAQHAGLMAARFGDLVDEWGTLNEPRFPSRAELIRIGESLTTEERTRTILLESIESPRGRQATTRRTWR